MKYWRPHFILKNLPILGIDVEQLIKDLSFGIRLQKPIFCPQPIAILLEKCFYASPDQRPNFEEIKAFLVAAYDMLFDRQKESNVKNFGIIDNNVNKAMQVQYSTVIQMNKEQKNRDYASRKEHGYLYMKKKSLCSIDEIKTEDDSTKDDCDDGQMHKTEHPDKFDSAATLPTYKNKPILIDVTQLN